MFDLLTAIRERALDAADLLIDFATLGEYGLEPAPATPPCRTAPCRAPGARAGTRSTPSRTAIR